MLSYCAAASSTATPFNSNGTALPSVQLPAVPLDSNTNTQTNQLQPNTATQPAIPGKGSADKKEIYLNFENTDLTHFIEYMAELKKLSIIPDKTTEGAKISLTIREPLSVNDAWSVFLTVLEMSGFSIIESGLVHKIVPKDKKLAQPLPAFINVSYDKLPDNDTMIRYVFFLTNIQTSDIQPVLDSMLSQPNSVYELKDMNAFIITDKALNIRAAAKLLTELDQMGLPESVTVMRLKRINAADAKALLDQLIRTKSDANQSLARLLGKVSEGNTEYFAPTTRIIPEERTNSLILLGNSKSIDKVVDFIANNIDTDLKAARSPLHIYELQHIDATQVAEILRQVTQMPESTTGQVAGKYGSIRGGVKYFKNMTFQVDKDGNRLIINCSDDQDWALVKSTIEDLDKPQPQVAIETLIVTVNADDVASLGGAIRNKKHGSIGKNIDFQSAALNQTGPTLEGGDAAVSLLGNMLGQLTRNIGSTVLSFGKDTIWGALQAVKTQDSGSIIAQPFITVANKSLAHIEVGESKRVVDQTQGSTQGFKTVPAATALDITPQINLEGIIRMNVSLTISEFTDTAGNNTSEKKVTTDVTVADGQVLVLGGFVKTKVDESKNKTPILGDIPLLGWFFKNQTRTITKQYIFIFIAPTIVKPRQTPGMQLYTKMKLHQATSNIEDAVETKRVLDPVHNWFFNTPQENYSHKVIDFANARYQPTTVDIKNDLYYRSAVTEPSRTQVATPKKFPASLEPLTAAPQPLSPSKPQATSLPPSPAPEIKQQPKPPAVIKNEEATIDVQRSALQELLTTPPVTNQPQLAPIQQQSLPSLPLSIPHEPGSELVIDPAKRNSLKDFLSANSALARYPGKTSPSLRRV
jgi:general secretion pathway protein D